MPIWKGTRPYQQIVFQFSVHILEEAGELRHAAFLDLSGNDPSEPFAKVLAGPGVMVAHAASQDLEVLARACQLLPSSLFDTQVAAGFLGYGSASLASLVDRFLHVRLAKGDRLSDWNHRPLTASQLSYAASDVAHLLALTDMISGQLSARGRLVWAEEECAALLARPVGATDPDEAWWKLRDNRQLQGTARAVAQEVAAWRERKARQHDLQPRMVLPDLALLSIAHGPPPNADKLHETRGIDARYLRGGADQEIMAAVARGRVLPVDLVRVAQVDQVSKELRPAVARPRPGWPSWPGTRRLTPPSWPPAATWSSSSPSSPRRASGKVGGPGWSVRPCASWPAVPRRWPWTATGACSWRTGRVTARGPERSGGTTPRLGGRFPAAGR